MGLQLEETDERRKCELSLPVSPAYAVGEVSLSQILAWCVHVMSEAIIQGDIEYVK